MRCSIPDDWWQLSVVRRSGHRGSRLLGFSRSGPPTVHCHSGRPRQLSAGEIEVLIEGESDDVASTGSSSTSVDTNTATGE